MNYSDFINDVVMDAPGAPVPVVTRAIREAMRIFCKESTAYRKKLAPTDLSYDTVTGLYTITIPTGFQLETVISPIVFSDGINTKTVQGASPEWLDINHTGWRIAASLVDVAYFAMLSTNTFKLAPDNGVDRKASLTVSLVLMPDRTALPTMDDEFCNRWFDSIVAGAKFLLMVQPGSEWSNPDLAAFFKTKFDDGIQEAKSYISTGLRHPKADGIRHVRLYYK